MTVKAWAKGGELRFRDLATGQNLLSHHEEHARQPDACHLTMFLTPISVSDIQK